MTLMPLWKKCRILANAVRLDMLSCLDEYPRLCVKEVGERLGVSEDVSSKNLQLLDQAGFLQHERRGKFLFYSLVRQDQLLSAALAAIAEEGRNFDGVIFWFTALTHERRVLIVSVLNGKNLPLDALCRRTQISPMAMRRQLDKLVRRGFVDVDGQECKLLVPGTRLGRVLVEMAVDNCTPAQV